MSYGNEFQESLHPGILIESKVSSGGTLGCFAHMAGDSSKIVLLSNSHVLFSDVQSLGGTGVGVEVGQPSVSCCLCCSCRVIATNRDNAFNNVTVNVTNPVASTESGSVVDCAIADLNDERPYTNETLYGMITGTPASGFGLSAGDAVEKVGSTTGHTTGTVLGFTTTGTLGSGSSLPSILYPYTVQGTDLDENFAGVISGILQLLILPDADPNDANRKMHFCAHGDSGSVIVNGAKQVVGLISRAWRVSNNGRTHLNSILQSPLPPHAGTLGIASPIGPVLQLLNIEIANSMSGTVTSAGQTLADFKLAESGRQRRTALQLTLRDLEREIRSKKLGRTAMEALNRHRHEVLRLVDRKRQVKVSWHRNQGPAFAAHCLRSVGDHNYVIPVEERGVTPIVLLQKMATVLKRHGSAELREDIEAYEELVLDWVNGCTSVWQLVDKMRQLENLVADDMAGPMEMPPKIRIGS